MAQCPQCQHEQFIEIIRQEKMQNGVTIDNGRVNYNRGNEAQPDTTERFVFYRCAHCYTDYLLSTEGNLIAIHTVHKYHIYP
jgi:hypothetical protein